MAKQTAEQLTAELREAYEGALGIIEQQRSQLSLAFCVLAELGFDLNEWMDVLVLN